MLLAFSAGCVSHHTVVRRDTAELAGLATAGRTEGAGSQSHPDAEEGPTRQEAADGPNRGPNRPEARRGSLPTIHHSQFTTSPGITWYSPVHPADESALARWRGAVGPAVVRLDASSHTPTAASREITIASWNIANGGGDVLRFARTLPAGRPLVLLLQEAYRGGPEVPDRLPAGVAFAARLGGRTADPDTQEVEAIAEALGLNVYYVPSMRNGGPASDEDRGNAVLSNLPLTDLRAVELPFERQRRVAVVATVNGTHPDGRPWTLRVASVHLDNMSGIRRAWIGGEYGRTRQARAIREVLDSGVPTIVGGDFNTWFGFSEPSYIETARAFPDTRVSDGRPTFRGLLRLDHLFFRLAPGWQAAFRRADDRFGSDHFPLVGTLTVP